MLEFCHSKTKFPERKIYLPEPSSAISLLLVKTMRTSDFVDRGLAQESKMADVPENAPERKKAYFFYLWFSCLSFKEDRSIRRFRVNSLYNLDQLTDCPGTGSEQAGKSSACQGCPNQSICSSSKPMGPDPGDLFSRVTF